MGFAQPFSARVLVCGSIAGAWALGRRESDLVSSSSINIQLRVPALKRRVKPLSRFDALVLRPQAYCCLTSVVLLLTMLT